jgi:tRNA G37 N-methylase TrmD
LFEAVEAVLSERTPLKRVVLLSAHGRQFTQSVAREYAALDELLLICGR